MTREQINRFFERVNQMNPKPVITVTEKVWEKDKKEHFLRRRSGVFGWWNGEEGSFETRATEKRKKGFALFFVPFCLHEIVSVKMVTERKLIDDQNLLFQLEEEIRRARNRK